MTSIVLVLLLVMTLRSLSSAPVVNQNVIYGVVSGYVLIGFIGGLLAIAIAWAYPDAFNVDGIISGPQAIYYSFITMTTLGYGDITPTIQETRSLSILLSILGPMYVAIIVALMVGKFAASNGTKK
ncbi:ion channel, partial [Bacteroidota bacterium]